jgi:hypothetical protein
MRKEALKKLLERRGHSTQLRVKWALSLRSNHSPAPSVVCSVVGLEFPDLLALQKPSSKSQMCTLLSKNLIC